MKISNAKRTVLTAAIREAFSGYINIYESGAREDEWEVNWSALGSQPTEIARDFAEDLKLACKITDWLNQEHVAVDYSLAGEYTDREELGNAARAAADLIKNGQTGRAMRSIFSEG